MRSTASGSVVPYVHEKLCSHTRTCPAAGAAPVAPPKRKLAAVCGPVSQLVAQPAAERARTNAVGACSAATRSAGELPTSGSSNASPPTAAESAAVSLKLACPSSGISSSAPSGAASSASK